MNLSLKKSLFAGLIGPAIVFSADHRANAVLLTIDATEDATLSVGDSSFFTSSSYGGNANLFVTPFVITGSLLRFDTANLGLLSGATIHSVTLNLTISVNVQAGGIMPANTGILNISQLTAANSNWVEGAGSGAGASNELAVTNNFRVKTVGGDPGTGTTWAAGGDFATGTGPIAGNVVSTANVANLGGQTYTVGQTYGFTLDNGIVTGWAGNPTLATAGLFMHISNSSVFIQRSDFGFHSSESATVSFRPNIVVDYTPVPEPTMLVAFAGGLGLLALRRRSHGVGSLA